MGKTDSGRVHVTTAKMKIFQFPCRSDNYGVILIDREAGVAISIDAPETEPIADVLDSKKVALTHILTTHHHGDHVEGVERLRERYGSSVVGAAADSHRLPPLDTALAPGDTVRIEARGLVELDVAPRHNG